jgi:hypothetical protein
MGYSSLTLRFKSGRVLLPGKYQVAQFRNKIGHALFYSRSLAPSFTVINPGLQAIKNKGLEPENRKLRRDFTRRILVSLHDLRKAGTVEKIGHGRGVVRRLKLVG